MQHPRSRAGTVAMTTSALVLLSVPVVALAKGQPDVVGRGTETATTVVAPQARVPNPAPGLTRSAPASAPAPGQAKPAGQAATPAAPPAQRPVASVPGVARGLSGHAQKRRGPRAGVSKASASQAPAAPSSEPADGGADKSDATHKRSRSGSPHKSDGAADAPGDTADDGDAAAVVASDTVELPADASPETLPFTGLQLLLIAMAGLAAVGAGVALRRGVQRRRA